MNIPFPDISFIEVPFWYALPIFWFIGLWVFAFMFMRCECGSFYHTKKERKEFFNWCWFSVLSTLVIFAGAFVWSLA